MVSPVNVVAGGSLNREVSLEEVHSELLHRADVTPEFAENAPWQLLIRFKQGGMAILYRTGKYILRGGSSYDSLEEVKSKFFETISDSGIVSSIDRISYEIQNIVFLHDLGSEIDLAEAVICLGMNQTEYEPEQFPGVIYRPDDFGVVMLIFTSGKVIITGSTDEQEVETAVSTLYKLITPIL